MSVEEFISFNVAAMGRGKKDVPGDVNHLINICRLNQYRPVAISKLSSGYRQRCAIAGALAGDLSLLILDEPGKGLDPRQIVELREIIRNRPENISVIISSHILSEIELLCDRVLILDKGELKTVETSESIVYKVLIEGDKNSIESLVEETELFLLSLKEVKPSVFELKIEISSERHKSSGGAVIYDNVAKRSLRLFSLEYQKNTLEKSFMEITGEVNE